MDRRSWLWVGDSVIRAPAQMNRSALNNAWVIRWNRASLGICMPSLAIITPSWLRVDRAMIFFISDSVMADNPAINMVREAINSIA